MKSQPGLNNFWKVARNKKIVAISVAAIILVAGLSIVLTRAASFFAAIELEQATLSTNAKLVNDSRASGGQAVQFTAPTTTPPPTTGVCAVSTPHVPDGPDGMGGCWPGASNTGPNAAESSMTAYTGSCTVNTANVTIESKIVNCSPLNVGNNATNLMIKNSYVKGGVISNGSATFTIQDSLIDNAVSYPACSGGKCAAGKYACGDINNATAICGVGYKNFTILRTEIVNTNRAAYCGSTCTIQDSYFHGTTLWPDATNKAHASSVRSEQYLTLRHNAIGCDYAGPYPNDEIGCSADLTGYPDFAPVMHATIDKNLFLANSVGNAVCAYGGGTSGKPYSNDPANATYIAFTNNIFQRGANGKCALYGPMLDFIPGRTGNVWTNNKYDNGTTVNPT